MKEQWEMWREKLKEGWAHLALREKQAVVLGGSVLGMFMVYQFIWTPYLDHVAAMRKRLDTVQKTLVWMTATDKEIKKRESHSKSKNNPMSPVAFMSHLQKQIRQARLEQYLTQLKQTSHDSIEMHFQKIEFDKLIFLLTTVIKEQPVSITQMSAIAENSPGVVNADVVLKSG